MSRGGAGDPGALQRAALLRVRALAAVFAWLPLAFDATESGDLLLLLPCGGLLAGVLPVRWFPVVGAAQVGAAVATGLLVPRRAWSGAWLFHLAFGLAMLLNLALWLRARAASGAGASVPDPRQRATSKPR